MSQTEARHFIAVQNADERYFAVVETATGHVQSANYATWDDAIAGAQSLGRVWGGNTLDSDRVPEAEAGRAQGDVSSAG